MLTFDNSFMTLVMDTGDKQFRVTAICQSVEEANAYCEANPDEGVIAEDNQQGRVFIAECEAIKRTHKGRSHPYKYDCALCEKPIPLGEDESSPFGSVHKGCAATHEAKHPDQW